MPTDNDILQDQQLQWDALDERYRTALTDHGIIEKAEFERLPRRKQNAFVMQAMNAIECTRPAPPVDWKNADEVTILRHTVLERNNDLASKEYEVEKQCQRAEAERDRADKASVTAAATLKEALAKWLNFNPPGMRPITKAKITRAVHLYATTMRSESKIAAEFGLSRKQVSKWFKLFTEATGFPVVTHRRHQSVRDHTHGPEHREGRRIIFQGEDNSTGTPDAGPVTDPFFSER